MNAEILAREIAEHAVASCKQNDSLWIPLAGIGGSEKISSFRDVHYRNVYNKVIDLLIYESHKTKSIN